MTYNMASLIKHLIGIVIAVGVFFSFAGDNTISTKNNKEDEYNSKKINTDSYGDRISINEEITIMKILNFYDRDNIDSYIINNHDKTIDVYLKSGHHDLFDYRSFH